MSQRPASRGMGMGPPPPTGGMRMPIPAGMGVGGVQPQRQPPPLGGFGSAPVGMRPPTNAGGRPGSSAGVPQGMRPPTAGGSSGVSGSASSYNPLQTEVNVVVRPVTGMASGVSGMPTKNMGPGRVIADKGYYVTDLNKKTNDISRELDNMRFEMNKIDADTALYAQLERKYDLHMKDVRVLEGQLADFNLAFDKLRTNTNVAEIKDMYIHLKERNEREKKQVDDIFLKAQHQEKQTKETEERINRLHAAAADRIASLGEEKHQEYVDLQEELIGVNEHIQERESLLNELEHKIAGYEDTMKTDAYRLLQAGQNLTKEISSLQKQKQELEDELHSELSPAEMKDKLTQKIKDATAETNEMEREIKRLESSIEKLGDASRNRENELNEARKHSSKTKKYDAIYERDAKMDEFIQAFPSVKNGEIENKRKLKELIVQLLKHISKEINSSNALTDGGGNDGPNASKHGELKDEVSFKDKKLADSEKTLVALQSDLAKRREELEKIDSLDTKISTEIKQLNNKIQSMQEEMRGFKSEDELRESSIQAKKDLLVENSKQKKAREAIRIQVGLLSAELEKKSKDLAASEPAKRVEAWEIKLKTHAGAVFTLQEYMQTKKRESQYEDIVKECSSISKDINDILVRQR
jgi:intraflagellar transport protein 74